MRLHVSERAYVKLLAGLGNECIGAVSLREPSAQPDDTYVEVGEGKLARFAEQSYPQAAETGERAHFSLAGSQAKIALYRGADGRWYEPRGMASSTHILKPTNDRFEKVAANEALCTMAAKLCGLNVPQVEVLDLGHPVVCTQRFDRSFAGPARSVGGMPVPFRLHQEDCCQALGVVPEHKYEEAPEGNFSRIARMLRMESSDPLADLQRLWDFAVFNYLIGNCDAHLKNIAVIRDSSWRSLRLAQFYDLLCTTCYEDLSGDMAMRIGQERRVNRIDAEAFEGLAGAIGVPLRIVMPRLEELCRKVPQSLLAVANELEKNGVELAGLADRIVGIAEANAARILS